MHNVSSYPYSFCFVLKNDQIKQDLKLFFFRTYCSSIRLVKGFLLYHFKVQKILPPQTSRNLSIHGEVPESCDTSLNSSIIPVVNPHGSDEKYQGLLLCNISALYNVLMFSLFHFGGVHLCFVEI